MNVHEWKQGPATLVGWYPASFDRDASRWRWWDGEHWSVDVNFSDPEGLWDAAQSERTEEQTDALWHYPAYRCLNVQGRAPLPAVGNLDSNARGAGARFNRGKPRLDLIPFELISAADTRSVAVKTHSLPPRLKAAVCLQMLGFWQMRKPEYDDRVALLDALLALVVPWDEVANVFEYGMGKYRPWNWAKGMPWSACLGSAARHLLAIMQDQDDDPESGLPHRAHAACNLVMLWWYVESFPEGDDRIVVEGAA